MNSEGNFSFIKNENEEKPLKIVYDTISELDLWNFLKSYTGKSFMMSTDTNINSIRKHPNVKEILGSDVDFEIYMQNMFLIATHGWEYYVNFRTYK